MVQKSRWVLLKLYHHDLKSPNVSLCWVLFDTLTVTELEWWLVILFLSTHPQPTPIELSTFHLMGTTPFSDLLIILTCDAFWTLGLNTCWTFPPQVAIDLASFQGMQTEEGVHPVTLLATSNGTQIAVQVGDSLWHKTPNIATYRDKQATQYISIGCWEA